MKRHYRYAFPENRRQSPRKKEGPWSLLPYEMVKEIISHLVRGPYEPWAMDDARRETIRAIHSIRMTNRSASKATLEVLRELWRDAYLALKCSLSHHDWHLPLPNLRNQVQFLYSTYYRFKDMGFDEKTQFGSLNALLFAKA